MKNSKLKSLFKFILMSILAVLLICGGFFLWRQIVAFQIASRLNVSPSWQAIRQYLIEETKPGMSRNDAHKVLDTIGPWHVFFSDPPDQGGIDSDTKKLVFREMVRFDNSMIRFSLGDWGYLYDKDGFIVEFELLDHY